MPTPRNDAGLITGMNVTEYFHDRVTSALHNQHVEAEQETVFYVINLLASYTRSDHLFTQTWDGAVMQPLALIYAEAVDASSPEARQNALRRLGDMALIIAGLFSDSLNRRLVDIDYYIAMGGSAYAYLSDTASPSTRGRVFGTIFGELSIKFHAFVDVLGEVSENAHLGSQTDVLRLYEVWVRTGSARAAAKLRHLGIEPAKAAVSRRQN